MSIEPRDEERERQLLAELDRLRAVVAELQRALELATQVLDTIGDGVYGLDAAGLVEFVNPAAARMSGYTQQELLGQDVHALLHGHHPDGTPYPPAQCPSVRARLSGQVETSLSEVFWRRDGSALPVSLIAVPRLHDGVATGVVVSFRDTTALVEADRQAELLADVTAREAAQRSLADQLQQALLTPPPEPDHLHVVVRYRAAASQAQVGGDWYDSFLQPDGATMLVIGDVVGHDGTAAAMMGQLRGVLRTIAHGRDDDTPAEVLSATERTARGLGVDGLATVILARVEREPDVPRGNRSLRWSNAGHLPPVLLRPDGSSELLDTEPDLLLGVDPGVQRHDHTVDLPDGCTLLMFTDGLVERRGAHLDTGLALVRTVLEDLAAVPLPELCDALLTRMAPEAGEDDIALVAVRTYPEDRPRPPEAGPNRLPAGVD